MTVGGWVRRTTQKLRPTATRKRRYQRIRLALGERVQAALDFLEFGKFIHALRAASQFADRLGAAQHQHAEQRRLAPAQVEPLAERMRIFFDAVPGSADLESQ